MSRFARLLFWTLFLAPHAFFAQNDSTLLLEPEALQQQHIRSRNVALQNAKAMSATRSLEDLNQLPFSVWTVTAEDILRYGFVTLGDVLRAAPGIRVSQPGNAIEGETFLMRGLAGNQYVKVLINDVPVKPTGAWGMPIGAQLPIRQAERIEVVYGPMAAIYGDEACAGVINIILKETERPVFTQADLSFGNNGYNSLDLTFGGKLGKDKNVFRFSFYGSSTVRDRTDLYGDYQQTHEITSYKPLDFKSIDYVFNPNYRPDSEDRFKPKLSPIPHESRLFGANFKWRGLYFNYHRMLRFDHMALGRNPFSVSWANPSNRLAERVETFSLGFNRARKRRTTHNTFSAIRYRIDNTSNTTYLYDQLSLAHYKIQRPYVIGDSLKYALLDTVFQRYASNERYAVAGSLDLRFESRSHYTLSPRLSLDAGGQVNSSFGVGLTTHHKVPIDARLYDDNYKPIEMEPYAPVSFSASDFRPSLFAQMQWRGQRFYMLAGGSLNLSAEYGLVPAPRAALLYHIDSSWTIYSNAGVGFRFPSAYAEANSFRFYETRENEFKIINGRLKDTETTHSFEAGVRFIRRTYSVSGAFFYQKAYNLMRPGYLTEISTEPSSEEWSYGFENTPGLAMTNWGIQMLYSTKKGYQRPKKTLNLKFNNASVHSWIEFYAQYTRGKEWFGSAFPSTNEVRNQPRWTTQMRMFLSFGSKAELMLSSNRQTSVLSKAVTYKDLWQRETILEHYPTFRSWDMMLRFYLNEHFLVYFQMQNMFDAELTGLDATGTIEDLIRPVQQGRLMRLGMNYNMN